MRIILWLTLFLAAFCAAGAVSGERLPVFEKPDRSSDIIGSIEAARAALTRADEALADSGFGSTGHRLHGPASARSLSRLLSAAGRRIRLPRTRLPHG